ncbi:hypothetical protein Q9L58_006388 [Maublancomyces gigas]|uniref:Gingipain domain-containing protein n=1 Tax=Discina gigas TaxID=1032678 RepID=A0ABR3GFC9_9PEZI
MNPPSWSLRGLLCLALTITSSYAQTLPVFRVQANQAGEAGAVNLAQLLFGLTEVQKSTTANKRHFITSTDGTKCVEFDTTSGGFWVADHTQLWNTALKPKLVDEETALCLAEDLAKDCSLFPELKGPIRIKPGRIGGTFVAQETEVSPGQNQRLEHQLDISVNYDITILVQTPESTTPVEVPVVGGGGKFQLTFGDGGNLIGYQGLWRDVDVAGTKQYKIIPKSQADSHFLTSTTMFNDTLEFNSTLAYYSAPYGEFQDFLYPVYVFDATAMVGEEFIQLRRTYFPATEFGPVDTFVREVLPPRRVTSQPSRHRSLRPRGTDDTRNEAGTEWIGVPYGLQKTEQNAQGFRNQLLAGSGSWEILFNFGDDQVWETDFDSQADQYVDTTDFIFYTGHAGPTGWLANIPNKGGIKWVHYSIVGTFPETPGNLWGRGDLEWMVIAACGPLQDERFIAGGGNAFDRWRGMFDGLHIMFSYGTNSDDTSDEGRRLIAYAQNGAALIDSWFRTAKELQPSSATVTAMWTAGPGGDSRNDHLTGYGMVTQDNPASSQVRWLMWSSC